MTYNIVPKDQRPQVERFNWKQMKEAAEKQDHWVVPGIISSQSTLIYGEAKVGKSFLTSALLAEMLTGGKSFLGEAIQEKVWRVAILATDDRAEAEYAERILTVVPEDAELEVEIFRISAMRNFHAWQSIYSDVMEAGYNFVVIDNLTQAVNGTINDDNAVKEFFEGVRLFTRSGIPVVVIGHASEKIGQNGAKSTLPMGSSYITQAVRHRIFASLTRGSLSLKFKGNYATTESMTLTPLAGARYEVVSKKTLGEAAEESQKKTQARDASTLDKNARIAQFVVDNCQGLGVRKAADKIAAEFGGAAGTHSSNLSAGRAYGALVNRDAACKWTLAS